MAISWQHTLLFCCRWPQSDHNPVFQGSANAVASTPIYNKNKPWHKLATTSALPHVQLAAKLPTQKQHTRPAAERGLGCQGGPASGSDTLTPVVSSTRCTLLHSAPVARKRSQNCGSIAEDEQMGREGSWMSSLEALRAPNHVQKVHSSQTCEGKLLAELLAIGWTGSGQVTYNTFCEVMNTRVANS
jgi:hypothetical protein